MKIQFMRKIIASFPLSFRKSLELCPSGGMNLLLISHLVDFRFKEIATALFREVTSTSYRSMKAVYVIEGARHLRLPLSDGSGGLGQAVTFIDKLSELFIHTDRMEVSCSLFTRI